MIVRARLLAAIPLAGLLLAALAFLAQGMTAGCQTTCSSNTDCSNGDYCQFVEGECLTTTPLLGYCQSLPDAAACTGLVSPVCGCNGESYESPCAAALASQTVAASGYCQLELCASLVCPGGQTCQCPSGMSCETDAGLTGRCEAGDGGT
jgi:Kazal-type serine protease inhibitor domain